MSNHTFTGVFIPAKIWLAKDLIPQEKMMLAEIKALSEDSGWCFASNGHFAEWLGCGTSNISNYIQRFVRDGMIEVTYTDTKTFAGRKIRVNTEWFHGLATPYTGNVTPYTGSVTPYTGSVTEIQFKATLKKEEEEGEKSETLKERNSQQMEVPPAAAPGPVRVEIHDNDFPGTKIVDEVPVNPWRSFNIDEQAAELKADEFCRDKFGMDMNMTLAAANIEFPKFIDEFVAEQKAYCKTYHNTTEFRKHFFFWSLTAPKAKAAAKRPQPGPGQQRQQQPYPSALPRSLQGLVGK